MPHSKAWRQIYQRSLYYKWLERLSIWAARTIQGVTLGVFALGGLLMAPIALPLFPVEEQAWATVSDVNGELNEIIGWLELVETVASIYSGSLITPPADCDGG